MKVKATDVRFRFQLTGRLQGIGFRPWVYRLANELRLLGWVKNTAQGVEIQLQGPDGQVSKFEHRLFREQPALALIRTCQKKALPPLSPDAKVIEKGFQIRASDSEGNLTAEVLPDLAVCPECKAEVLDPENRRYRYAFTNCTYCGPRYSILKKLPYDRKNTTMATFQMCETCLREYRDPLNRRFHAQSQCCPDCGPVLTLKDGDGNTQHEGDAAVLATVARIRAGAIIAVQGIGGFHLFCDSLNDGAIQRLRKAKQRVFKPFALMVRDLEQAHTLCKISTLEEKLLMGHGAPIVLLRRHWVSPAGLSASLSAAIAPGIPSLGLLLPYTPLHLLLMKELAAPLVATSANIADEPLLYVEAEARVQLRAVADYFLVHNRLIASRVDDSVVREIAGTEVVLRAGRGYAPLVLEVAFTLKRPAPQATVIGLGAHQKSTLALGAPGSLGAPGVAPRPQSRGFRRIDSKGRIVLLPHLGNLDTVAATDAYRDSLQQLKVLYDIGASQLIGDLHPDYRSTRVGQALDPELLRVQHHEAHLLSCVAEHGICGPILGVAWDGAGLGPDGGIWGGEFLEKTDDRFIRVGHFRPFRLPGGTVAMREPRRAALGLLFEIFGESCSQEVQALGFTQTEVPLLMRVLKQRVNSPQTSSVGRLFDAIAALVGLCPVAEYEGQAATELESAVDDALDKKSAMEAYPVRMGEGVPAILDWEPWVRGVLQDRREGLSVGRISAKFHRTLAHSIGLMAQRSGISQVVLSGGCFQNRILCEATISILQEQGFKPYWNQKVPPNDGGISVGQVMGGWNVLVNSR